MADYLAVLVVDRKCKSAEAAAERMLVENVALGTVHTAVLDMRGNVEPEMAGWGYTHTLIEKLLHIGMRMLPFPHSAVYCNTVQESADSGYAAALVLPLRSN